jgi:hypothetical protein
MEAAIRVASRRARTVTPQRVANASRGLVVITATAAAREVRVLDRVRGAVAGDLAPAARCAVRAAGGRAGRWLSTSTGMSGAISAMASPSSARVRAGPSPVTRGRRVRAASSRPSRLAMVEIQRRGDEDLVGCEVFEVIVAFSPRTGACSG